MRATCTTYRIILSLITLMTFEVVHKLICHDNKLFLNACNYMYITRSLIVYVCLYYAARSKHWRILTYHESQNQEELNYVTVHTLSVIYCRGAASW